MSRFIELEIQSLLRNSSSDNVGSQLVHFVSERPEHLHNPQDISALALFLINTQQYKKLIEFCAAHIPNEDFACPWTHLLNALARSHVNASEKLVRALQKANRELNLTDQFAQSIDGEVILPEIADYRSERATQKQREYLDSKRLLIDELRALRIQGLVEKEKEQLKKLQQLFPGDLDIQEQVSLHRQRYALEILSKHASRVQRASHQSEKTTPEDSKESHALEADLLSMAQTNPHLAYDLAILAYSLESYSLGLSILEDADANEEALWLRMELLLKSRRYLDLLNELVLLEQKLAAHPETFFATAYLRAQALWGLGQKSTAIEVMEGLLAARPNYRSGLSLLDSWRGQ